MSDATPEERCPSISDQGLSCGLRAGHKGQHNALGTGEFLAPRDATPDGRESVQAQENGRGADPTRDRRARYASAQLRMLANEQPVVKITPVVAIALADLIEELLVRQRP